MPHATLPTPRIYKTSEAITLKARQRARDLVLKAKAGDTLAQAKWSAQKQDYADRYVKKFGDDEEAKAKYFASRKLREQKKERMRQVLSQAQATVDENTGTAKMEPSDEVESEQEDGMKREVRDDEGSTVGPAYTFEEAVLQRLGHVEREQGRMAERLQELEVENGRLYRLLRSHEDEG